jgi:hypothetical protein
MSNGYIIPCEAFKGVSSVLPELILGHISEESCLERALERAKAIPWLTCFQDKVRAVDRWQRHQRACWICQCPHDICDEGTELLAAGLTEIEEADRMMVEVRRRVKESGYLEGS